MEYEEFIDGVADRAALPPDEAETLTHATLQVLGERLSAGEAEDLRAQLPKQLKVDLVSPREEAEAFDADEFAQRVAGQPRSARMGQVKALMPVMSRPTIRLWMCSVPS
jgi:uncharacterized protein (DUF2267 family)